MAYFGTMLIGIGGPSRAGKTTLARLLSAAIVERDMTVAVIHQDEHVIPEEELPMIRDKRDWEVPSSIDWATLRAAIKYHQDLVDIVIVEGLFCFHHQELVQAMDHRLIVRIDKPLFVRRKMEDLRWGSEREPDWYIEHIWASYERYGLPADVIGYYELDGSQYFDIEEIVQHLLTPTLSTHP